MKEEKTCAFIYHIICMYVFFRWQGFMGVGKGFDDANFNCLIIMLHICTIKYS